MDDDQIFERINDLSEEEERLYGHAAEAGLSAEEVQRLRSIEVQLDQSYDLLAQRRARRSAGQDPEGARARPEDTVEHYQQ